MAGIAAKGAILAYESSASPSTYSTIPGVGDFDMPLVGERDKMDATSHDSPGDYEEKVMGIKRTPTMSVPINKWNPKDNVHHSALITRGDAGTVTKFKVTIKDGSIRSFDGYVSGISESNPVAGVINATVSIEITGEIVKS